MKSFLICPVRGVNPHLQGEVVKRLERNGYTVHWPSRDTDQDDPYGLRICQDNRDAIKEADVIHVMWDGKSQGCLFDLGMAFALNKPIKIVQLPEPTIVKSFENMVRVWAAEL